MMSEFVSRYELGRQWWQGWHKGGKGAPPNTNPLGIGAKLRAAGAELISEVYAPKTAPDDGSASLGGAAAVVDMFIDGMRKDVAKSKARRVQTRNDTEYR